MCNHRPSTDGTRLRNGVAIDKFHWTQRVEVGPAAIADDTLGMLDIDRALLAQYLDRVATGTVRIGGDGHQHAGLAQRHFFLRGFFFGVFGFRIDRIAKLGQGADKRSGVGADASAQPGADEGSGRGK